MIGHSAQYAAQRTSNGNTDKRSYSKKAVPGRVRSIDRIPLHIIPAIERLRTLVISRPGVPRDKPSHAGIEITRPQVGQPRGIAHLPGVLEDAAAIPRAGECIAVGRVHSVSLRDTLRNNSVPA